MNPTHITFPRPSRELRLKRPPSADSLSFSKMQVSLKEGQHRLLEDNEALRVREENLKAYERRLRSMQEQLEASGSPVNVPKLSVPPMPVEAEGNTEAAWNKIHRTRELLEVEQRQLCDDQHKLALAQKEISRQESAVAAREVRVAERDLSMQAAASKPTRGLFGLTRAPFGRTE